ncbi:MAG: hypothetical protein ACJ04N_05485 [Oceanospirillaceae bacterium]|nr:hypothetical protein [Pseudomonadales bacterium]
MLTDLIKELGAASIDQLIYAWVLALLSKSLGIIGSGKIERVKGVLGGAQISLTSEQWYRIWSAFKGHSVA